MSAKINPISLLNQYNAGNISAARFNAGYVSNPQLNNNNYAVTGNPNHPVARAYYGEGNPLNKALVCDYLA